MLESGNSEKPIVWSTIRILNRGRDRINGSNYSDVASSKGFQEVMER